MSNTGFLLVPMVVDALVVNQHLRLGGSAFVRNEMQYNGLARFSNADPGSSSNDTAFTSDSPVGPQKVPAAQYYNGVYLKWRLPQYFSHGHQDSVTGIMTYPQVPNRWLVVRSGGTAIPRTSTAWIVESDYLWPAPPQPGNLSQTGSHYVVPNSSTDNRPVQNFMGRNVPLGSWTESGHTLNLQAVGPGNPMFSAYQPHCNNVFSFVDPIYDLPDQTLSYMVLGWFAVPSADPLFSISSADFVIAINAMGWNLPPNTPAGQSASQCLLEGIVTGVVWQTDTIPAGGVPPGQTTLAMGHTAVEALTGLITGQADAMGIDLDPSMLQAFQLGLIDELDQPNGMAVVDEEILSSFFSRYNGGYTWDIVDAPDAAATASQAELDKEAAWLAALNGTQSQLDSAIRQLSTLQSQLYVMWWKYLTWGSAHKGTSPIPKLNDQANFAAQLDVNVSGSLAAQTSQAITTVTGLLAQVPSGATQDALTASIQQYETQQALPTSRQLKRSTSVSFYEENDPVLLIAGAGALGIAPPVSGLQVRFMDQAETGCTVGTKTITSSTPGLTIPQPVLSGAGGVPWSVAQIATLVNEMFFVDPANAAALQPLLPGVSLADIQAAMTNPTLAAGTYPTGAVNPWTANPWRPLRLLYEARFYPISYGTTAAPNWTFYDGQYYWNGKQSSVNPYTTFAGDLLLTPAASFNMQARLTKFLADNPYLPPEEAVEFEALLEFVRENDTWNMLSQALSGFRDQMQLEMPGAYMSPGAFPVPSGNASPLASMVGDVRGCAPNLGNIPTTVDPPSSFLPWRSGQFVLYNLTLVDEWGQALWLVKSGTQNQVKLFLPPTLSPVITSPPISFSVAVAPTITSVSPAVVAAGSGNVTLTLNGAAFASGDTVFWNGTALATTFTNQGSLQAVVTANLMTAPGQVQLTVLQAHTQSAPFAFSIFSGPAIGSVSPTMFLAGMAQDEDVPLTVTGANFASDAVVLWNGFPLDTVVVGSTELSARVPSANVATRGNVPITVSSGGMTTTPISLSIVACATIASLQPAGAAKAGPTLTVDAHGVGFEPPSRLQWGGVDLVTTYVSATHLQATIPASFLGTSGNVAVTQVLGYPVLPQSGDSLVQLAPGILQPARLSFELLSVTTNHILPKSSASDPICGWVIPNHLDQSLAAYSSSGVAFGELSVGASLDGTATVNWFAAPNSPYATLAAVAKAVPYFGPFLLTLSTQTPAVFTSFLKGVDETLWTSAPAGSAMDDSMAALIGRPLAMLRASLQLQVKGTPATDPSWQFTFSAAPPLFTSYEFAVELGDISNVEDGLVGYFLNDDYTAFNIAPASGADANSYLKPIGANNNYIYLPPDNTTTATLSMLVDPRASVHARTSILPDTSLAAPPALVSEALANMNILYRVDAILTDQQIAAGPSASTVTTLFLPYPNTSSGTWTWVEYEGSTSVPYPIAAADTVAKLSTSQPVLRQGLMQLSTSLGDKPTPKTVRTQLAGMRRKPS